MPSASTILMIRPAAFGFNRETAINNYFQKDQGTSSSILQEKAIHEFDDMVQILRSHGVDVLVIEDTNDPPKPDAVFPNNWLSTTPDGSVNVFPLYAPSRRPEKREDILKLLSGQFVVKEVQDWSEFEPEGRFLEGTGSMVTDYENKMIYAAVSERTNIYVLEKFAATNGFQAIVFLATDKNGRPVYHTNVVMSLGENFAILCEEAIDEEWELIAVRQLLESTGHNIIPITREQMHRFAGNMLPVINGKGEKILIMSQSAFDSLTKEQLKKLETLSKLLPVALPTIEATGGGSARCMMAEIYLQRK